MQLKKLCDTPRNLKTEVRHSVNMKTISSGMSYFYIIVLKDLSFLVKKLKKNIIGGIKINPVLGQRSTCDLAYFIPVYKVKYFSVLHWILAAVP